MENESFTDHELVLRLREEDSNAFRILYEKYGPGLQAFCTRFRFSKEESEEIVQESFIRIWQNRARIDPSKSFNTFLITIAKHLIYNQIRHNKYRSDYAQEIRSQFQPISSGGSPDDGELQQLVSKAMMELPDKCRQVFRKSRLEGYSNLQIAEEMNISKSTVENQLNKALKRIRGFILNHGYKALKMFVVCSGIHKIFIG